jgi:hypothetical protein
LENGKIFTEVPDNQFFDHNENAEEGRFIHEFFHAFDFSAGLRGGSPAFFWSSDSAFWDLRPNPIDRTCGPTSYACTSPQESFADSAAVYALDNLRHNGPEADHAEKVWAAYGDAGQDTVLGRPKPVAQWNDGYPNVKDSLRRISLDLGFFWINP